MKILTEELLTTSAGSEFQHEELKSYYSVWHSTDYRQVFSEI